MSDEVSEVIGAVAGDRCRFNERQRLVTYRLEGGFQLYRRELPEPGGGRIAEVL